MRYVTHSDDPDRAMRELADMTGSVVAHQRKPTRRSLHAFVPGGDCFCAMCGRTERYHEKGDQR